MTLRSRMTKTDGVDTTGGFLFERPKSGERAILVQVAVGGRLSQDQIEEFEELARSAGARICASLAGSRQAPNPRFYIGAGKVEELRALALAHDAELVLFNHELSPSQERNLERELQCRVLDRTGLILDIFAQRARSFEGKLQVELAQLEHLSTRLVRGWTHLERQKGGIGLRGPGETQLETDRRLLGQRIKQLNRKLDRVRQQREQGRRTRRRAEVPTVSLVGYTNAGKSTLFNRLTESGVYVADQLFATLDPTLRGVDLGEGQRAVLADTVGFVRDLPHELVEAFRSTLQETREAALLLHVIDASDSSRRDRIEQVEQVIEEIGADEVPQVQVFNKIDLVNEQPRLQRDEWGRPVRVWASAADGRGMDLILQALRERLAEDVARGKIHLTPAEGRFRAGLYTEGGVVSEEPDGEGGWLLELALPRRRFLSLCRRERIDPERLKGLPCATGNGYLQSRTVA
jgi:GTP-binding protein HflX